MLVSPGGGRRRRGGGDENLRLELLQLLLHVGQLGVAALDHPVDVRDALPVPGHLAQVLRPLLDLELLLDLAAEELAQLLHLLRERGVREVRLEAVLEAQLVQERQAEVVVLKQGKRTDFVQRPAAVKNDWK